MLGDRPKKSWEVVEWVKRLFFTQPVPVRVDGHGSISLGIAKEDWRKAFGDRKIVKFDVAMASDDGTALNLINDGWRRGKPVLMLRESIEDEKKA